MSSSARPRRTRPRGRAELTQQDILKAAALKRFRETAGMTQEELAERLEVSQGTLSDWERGRKPIPTDRYAAIEAVFADLLAAQQAAAAQPGPSGAWTPPPAPPEPPARDSAPGPHGPQEPPHGAYGPFPGAPPEGPPMSDEEAAAAAAMLRELSEAAGSFELDAIKARMALEVCGTYQLVAHIVRARVDEGAGAIIYQHSPKMAASLVAAADTNAIAARLLSFMQLSPGAACLFVHATCAFELVEYMRQKRRTDRLVRESEAATRTVRATDPPPAPPAPTAPTVAPAAGHSPLDAALAGVGAVAA